MHHVLTFIAPASAAKLRARTALLNQLRARLNPVRVVWLSEDACDFLLERRPAPATLAWVGQAVQDEQVDAVLQPSQGRAKKLFVADMDSTMIGQECIDELAECVGARPQVAAITERAMRGELDFKEALRERVMLLKGLTTQDLDRVYHERITLTPGAQVLIATLKQRGTKTLLVSGGFRFFTSRVAAIGFDGELGNTLDMQDDTLTGHVAEPILDKNAKQEALLKAAADYRVPLALTMAVGDGANDIPMLQAAGLGVAYHAKPLVEQSAAAIIRYSDLSALLYVQGIAKKDWVAVTPSTRAA